MTRQDIEKNTIAFFRTAGGTRPDLRLVEIDGRRVVVKDFNKSDALFRLLVGPILIHRERKALMRLANVPGVPQFIESIDCRAIVMEHIEGSSLKDFDGEIPEGFFDKLADIMRSIHKQGITHCDLRSSGNTMVTRQGDPGVVDFAACVMRGRGWNLFINFLFRNFVDGDDFAVLMLKRKHAPDTLRPEELDRLANPLPYEVIAKKIGCSVRNITRKLLIRKKTKAD